MEWLFLALAVIAALIILGYQMVFRRRAWVDANKSLQDSLAGCQALLKLTAHFQQHRGMSSAWLAGDASFSVRLDAKAAEIDQFFPVLRKLARLEGDKPHPCLGLNELALFQHRWGQLREKLPALSVEQSIAQHSFLVDQLLQWLSALGEARLEPVVADGRARAQVRNYASRLPALTETLGQARAVGMSVAARRGCSAVARVRLMFLVARAESLLAQAREAGEGSPACEAAGYAVQEMARVVRTRMLLSVGVTVGPQEYFDLATRAIDGVFGWIGESGDQMSVARLTAFERMPAHAQTA